MGEELNDLAVAIEKVLGKVPGNLRIRGLCLKVGVQGTLTVTLDVALAEQGEAN